MKDLNLKKKKHIQQLKINRVTK